MASMTDVIQLVDQLFEAADKDTMNVGDIRRSVESNFDLEMSTALTMAVKGRLRHLMTARAKKNVTVSAQYDAVPEKEKSVSASAQVTPEKDVDASGC